MKLKPIIATLVMLLATGALAACGSTEEPEGETTLRIGLSGAPGTFDAFTGGAGFHFDAVYDPILLTEQEPTPQPWLAESYSYNDDRTVLTLKIRDDVDFTDGEHLDAEVIKQNLDIHRGPDGGAAAFYAAIEEVVVIDEYTVEIRQSRASEEVLFIMRAPIVSPAALGDRESLIENPVGSGPYILESNDADTEYIFVRNEDYWNPEAFPFDRIEMIVMPDITARLNALKSGQIDFAAIDIATAPEVEASGLEYSGIPVFWQGLVLGDRRGEMLPALADVRVRRAIAMALDRETYNETVLLGLGSTSNQIGVAGQENRGLYVPQLADETPYDVEAAKELMAEAGYADGFDVTIPVFPGYLDATKPYILQALAEIGVRVTWLEDAAAAGAAFTDGTSPILLLGVGQYGLSYVTPGGIFNPWDNTDEETAELIDILNATDGDEYLEARQRLTEKILDEAWFAILSHEPNIWAFDSSVSFDAPAQWPTLISIQAGE